MAKRGVPSIDMTAMVDVAFLLLTFFILTTTKFREESTVTIEDNASSISDVEGPQTNVMNISVTKDGKVFAGYSDIITREKVLSNMSGPWGLVIDKEAAGKFSSLKDFGVPIKQLPQWLALEGEERVEFEQPGIRASYDSLTQSVNELKEWIKYGRFANPEMVFTVHGDADSPYPAIADVIQSLQECKVNRFNLITDLEDEPSDANVVAKRMPD